MAVRQVPVSTSKAKGSSFPPLSLAHPTNSQLHTILRHTPPPRPLPPTSQPLAHPARPARQDARHHSYAQPTRWPLPRPARLRRAHQWLRPSAPRRPFDWAKWPDRLRACPRLLSHLSGSGAARASAREAARSRGGGASVQLRHLSGAQPAGRGLRAEEEGSPCAGPPRPARRLGAQRGRLEPERPEDSPGAHKAAARAREDRTAGPGTPAPPPRRFARPTSSRAPLRSYRSRLGRAGGGRGEDHVNVLRSRAPRHSVFGRNRMLI